jgi:hypothetical protein
VIKSSVDSTLLSAIQSRPEIAAGVFYGCAPKVALSFPALAHLPGKTFTGETPVKAHAYSSANTFFAIPAHDDYRANAAAMGTFPSFLSLSRHTN